MSRFEDRFVRVRRRNRPRGMPIGGREDRGDAGLYAFRRSAAHLDVSGDQLAHPICDVAVVFVTAAEDSVVRAAHASLGVEDRVIRDPAEVERGW